MAGGDSARPDPVDKEKSAFWRELEEHAEHLLREPDGAARARMARKWYDKISKEQGQEEAKLAEALFDVATGWSTSEAALQNDLRRVRKQLEGEKNAFKNKVLYPVLAAVLVGILAFVGSHLAPVLSPSPVFLDVTKVDVSRSTPSLGSVLRSSRQGKISLELYGEKSVVRTWEETSLAKIYASESVEVSEKVDAIGFELRVEVGDAREVYDYKSRDYISLERPGGKCVLYRVGPEAGGGNEAGFSDNVVIHFAVRDSE